MLSFDINVAFICYNFENDFIGFCLVWFICYKDNPLAIKPKKSQKNYFLLQFMNLSSITIEL